MVIDDIFVLLCSTFERLVLTLRKTLATPTANHTRKPISVRLQFGALCLGS